MCAYLLQIIPAHEALFLLSPWAANELHLHLSTWGYLVACVEMGICHQQAAAARQREPP